MSQEWTAAVFIHRGVRVYMFGEMTPTPFVPFGVKLFGAASRRVRLSLLGPLQYLVPTFNFFLGWLAYNEKLDATRLVGFTFVWLGLIILVADSLRASKNN